jgi:glycine hydroxymethyltransferase
MSSPAKAVAFGEALQPEFKAYAQQVVENAKALAETLVKRGLRHRLGRHRQPPDAGRPAPKNATGKRPKSARARQYHLQQERRPVRPEKPFITSGIRLGTPAGTTRGFGVAEFKQS